MSHPGTEADAAAAEAVRRHHAQLAQGLGLRTESLLQLVETRHLSSAGQARADLLAYLRTELVPHARAEEETLYPAASGQPGGGPLVEGMIAEHGAITALVDELAGATSLTRAAAAARALTALFAVHLDKENELILPLLTAAAEVDLADLLAGMHELLGADEHAEGGAAEEAGGCGCGGCGCGAGTGSERESTATPVLGIDGRLDVRELPHAQRHAAVLSGVAALAPGGALVLVAPHAPRPVLAEIDARYPGEIRTQWLETGPVVWQVRVERTPTAAGSR